MYVPAGSVQATYNTADTDLKFLIINQPAGSENSTEILEVKK